MGGSMTKILPGLYVGGWRNATDEENLLAHNITHILSIVDVTKHLEQKPNRLYLRFDAADEPNQKLKQFFTKANDFIHDARKKDGACLVHCLAGVSRSVTLTVAYLMTLLDLSDVEALNSLRGFRHVASPNHGFKAELHSFYANEWLAERERFRSVHSVWQHEQRDLRILAKGKRNFQLFVDSGYYGNLSADDDDVGNHDGSEVMVGDGAANGDPLSVGRSKGHVSYMISHNDIAPASAAESDYQIVNEVSQLEKMESNAEK